MDFSSNPINLLDFRDIASNAGEIVESGRVIKVMKKSHFDNGVVTQRIMDYRMAHFQ